MLKVDTVGLLLVEMQRLRAELEAARAVVEAVRAGEMDQAHAYRCDAEGSEYGSEQEARTCTCGFVALDAAMTRYDAAKAGKAVE